MKYYSPNENQMRTTVKGADDYAYHRHRRLPWFKIAVATAFFALVAFVFLAGLLGWRVK